MRRLPSLTCLFLLAVAGTAHAAPASKRLPKAWAAANKVGLKQGARDTDRDGLSNWGEYRSHTNPRRRDSDRDGSADALEDRDRDTLVNADELRSGTDPGLRDSDGNKRSDALEDRDRDGLPNGSERVTGHDLRVRDTDGDGVADGQDNAGWITASSTGSVTIRLAAGGTLSARLTGDSFVDCSVKAAAPTSSPGAVTSTMPTSGNTTDPADSSVPTGDEPDDTIHTPDAPAPDPDVPPIEEDPAALPSAFASVPKARAAQDDGDAGDPGEAADVVDLGSCAAALRVGAVVHRAAVDADPAGSVLTDLALMKG